MTFMKTTRRRRRGAATRAADSVVDDEEETRRPRRVWTNDGPGDHDLDAERNTDGTRRNRTGSMDKTMKDGVVLHKIVQCITKGRYRARRDRTMDGAGTTTHDNEYMSRAMACRQVNLRREGKRIRFDTTTRVGWAVVTTAK